MTRLKFILTISLPIFLGAASYTHAEEVLEWKECVKEARAQHPDLASAAAKIKQNIAAKEVTRGTVMPQITGTASETTSKGAVFGSAGGGSSTIESSTDSNSTTTYDYGATVQQLLFDGFKTSYDLSGAERTIIASRYTYDVTSSNIRLSLRTAYVALLTAQELLKVTEDIEGRRKQAMELVKLRYEGGREHRGSLLTSEADWAQANFEVNQAKRSIYLAERQLTKELGRSKFVPITARGDFVVAEKDRDRPDFEKLCESTPLLRQLVAKKEAAKFGLSSAKAQFFPQIYATGTMNNTNIDAFPDKNEWSFGTSFSLPIFQGDIIAGVPKAKAAWKQAIEDERSGRDGVIYTLSNTWTTLQNTLDQVEVSRKSLEAASERAKISTAEYSIGLLTYDNWIIIENNLVTAKKTLLSAQQAALIAEANWIQAKGGTLDYDEQ